MRIGRRRAPSMRPDAVGGSVARSRDRRAQARSVHAIGFCPASFERCVYRLLEFLQAYWEEFRRPGQSKLQPACQKFMSAARSSLERAASVTPLRGDAWPGTQAYARAAWQQADQFIAVLDQAIDARKQALDGNLDSAIKALKLASSLVRKIPWGRLPERTHARDYDTLKWTVRRIKQMREGWSDRNYARTVRKLLRVDPGILELLAKELP